MAGGADAFSKLVNAKDEETKLTHLPISVLLLSEGHEARTQVKGYTLHESKTLNFADFLLGSYYQNKLRPKLRKESDKYICAACHGTGVLTATKPDSESNPKAHSELRKMFQNILYEILITEEENLSFEAIDNLFGLKGSKHFKKDVFEKFQKASILSVKSLNAYRKKNEKVFKNDEANKHIAKLGTELENNFQGTGLGVIIQPCGACNGTGYYDIGHVFDFGKQVDMMLYIYRKYILNGTGPWKKRWNKKIPVLGLLDKFFSLKVQPEIPKKIPNIDSFTQAQARAVANYKTNRDQIYIDLISSTKEDLTKRFDELYEKGTTEDGTATEGVPSFYEVAKFFKRVSLTARVSTGTLRKTLMKQSSSILQHYMKMKMIYKTSNMKDTPYPDAGIIIDGPSVGERLGSKATGSPRNILFVYASMYVPSSLHGGKGKIGVEWGKGQTMGKLIADSFRKSMPRVYKGLKGPNAFIKFFPQRVV